MNLESLLQRLQRSIPGHLSSHSAPLALCHSTTSRPGLRKLPGFLGSMVFRHAPIPLKRSSSNKLLLLPAKCVSIASRGIAAVARGCVSSGHRKAAIFSQQRCVQTCFGVISTTDVMHFYQNAITELGITVKHLPQQRINRAIVKHTISIILWCLSFACTSKKTFFFQVIAFDELKTDYKNPIDQCNSLNPVKF